MTVADVIVSCSLFFINYLFSIIISLSLFTLFNLQHPYMFLTLHLLSIIRYSFIYKRFKVEYNIFDFHLYLSSKSSLHPSTLVKASKKVKKLVLKYTNHLSTDIHSSVQPHLFSVINNTTL